MRGDSLFTTFTTFQYAPAVSQKPPRPALTERQRSILWLLALACVPATYANTLFTQTVAFAAQEFAISEQGQGIGAAIIRWGVVISLPLAALADRIGRRRLIIFCAFGAPIITALGGLAPSFTILVVTQTLGRPLALVLTILIGIVATEEMSSESRAWAISVLAIAAGFGAGFALAALPIADLGQDTWRYIYAISLVWLIIAIVMLRKLPETTRFTERRKTNTDMETHIDKSRLATQSLVAIFGNVFIAASSVFQVRYLRDTREYSAVMITAFTLITGTPASLGLLVGGRVADARGRRVLSALTFPLGAILLTVAFSTGGLAMWLASVSGGICLGLAYPAMAVYRGEMFPTLHRSFASGVIMTASLIGGSVGLVGAGYFLNRDFGYGEVMSWLALGPILAGLLVYATFPESAHLELEELNPQDVVHPKSTKET